MNMSEDAKGAAAVEGWALWTPTPLLHDPKPPPLPHERVALSCEPVPDQDAVNTSVAPGNLVECAMTLDAALQDAREQGHAQGLAQGREEGLATGRTEGYQAGYVEGHATGLATGMAEGQELVALQAARLKSMADSCAHSVMNLEAETGDALLSLAIAIARSIVDDTLVLRDDVIRPVLNQVLRLCDGQTHTLVVKLNPADVELASAVIADVFPAGRWRLQPDVCVDQGGCLIDTGLGSIDATLRARWDCALANLGRVQRDR